MTDDDFFAEALDQIPQTNNNTAEVIRVFKETMETKQQIEELSAVLEGLNKTLSKNLTKVLPELLNEMGTEIWRDPDTGVTVELELAVNSTLPKEVNKSNAILDALRPLGIEEIMAEEFNVTFSPNDQRAVAVREILGLTQPQDLLDEEGAPLHPRLSNQQMDLIQQLRESLGLLNLPAEEKLGVHAARLKKWLKERIEQGKGQEISDAGIWHGKHAKLNEKKAKK